ncbi:MAG: ketoacyl-ACP synthase III, partial [Verrucomicrobia bacterium]|nr:ketoacyl-ACP synthase III [Verrucomicrobiota bacterium]
MKASIKAISYYLPKTVVTNEDLAKQFPDWTVEKIESKIGILGRHVASEDETATDMAVEASNMLFAEYEFDRSHIDYLLFVTQSPDYILPTSACVIQHRLGLSTTIGALDINLGCSGYIYGLSVAKGLIFGGMAKNVLLVTSETYSKHLHPDDKGNRTIFGDAAAATIVSTDGFADIADFSFGTDGQGACNLIVKTGAARRRKPLNDLVYDNYGNPRSSDFLYMDGAAILNYTLDYFPPLIVDVLLKNRLEQKDIDLFVFHQANKYLMNLLQRKLKIDESRYFRYYETVGNTVSSTIPIALKEACKQGLIK